MYFLYPPFYLKLLIISPQAMHGITVKHALFTTGEPVSDKALYARIKRQEVKKRQEEKDDAVELEQAEAAATLSSMASLLSPPPPSLESNITSVTPGTVGTQNKRSMRKCKSPLEGTQNTIISSKAAAIEMLC